MEKFARRCDATGRGMNEGALQDYVEAASQKTFKGGGNGQNLLDEAMGLAGHIDSYALGRDTRGYEEDGFYGPLTMTAFKKLVDQMSADDIKNNQADKYESVVTEGKSAGLSKEETLKVAQKFADALAKVDGVKVTVSKGHEEDSFDLDYDGEEFAGGSYNIYKNGDVVNMAVPNYAVYGKMDDDIKTIIKNINKVSNESAVTEGKADYMARYKDTNINLKKAYNHLNDEELNQLYLEIGELIADNKLKVKDATFTFESVVNEKLARGLKPLLTIGSTITKNAGEDALLDLSDQFDKIDDEYAGDIASHLDMAIELMQDGYSGDATKKLKQFNKACMDVLKGKEIGSAFESTVNEAVKEVVLSNEILDFLEERGILKGSDAQKVHKDLTAFLKEKGINESVVTEGKSINKIQKEWSETTTAMSQKVEQWKSAEGDRKIELLDELKALTAKKRALESELDAAVAGKDKDLELVVSEGNAFGAARAEAIAKGEKEFTVDGETYPVESVDDEDKTNAEEFVEESKSDLWSYLIEKHTINEDLRTDIKKYIKSNKKEIDAMADQDNWEGIYSMLMKDFEVREDDVKMADEIKTIFNIVY